jgi:hypothetical protein
MSTQRRIANRTISAQDREFEELLRRAAHYAKAQARRACVAPGIASRPRKPAFSRLPLA